MNRVTTILISAVAAAAAATAATVLGGCAPPPPATPRNVFIGVDGSVTGRGLAPVYLNMLQSWLTEHVHEPMNLTVVVMGAHAGDASPCPAAEGSTAVPADTADLDREQVNAARRFYQAATATFDCASDLGQPGSDVTPWEQARAVNATEVLLFTDGLIFHQGEALPLRKALNDPRLVKRYTASLTATKQLLPGTTVAVFGAGYGRRLTDSQAMNLRVIWQVIVDKAGGRLTGWSTA